MKASDIVLSLQGHDAGTHFFVLAVEEDFVMLADGKRRKAEAPKKKKQKHVRFVTESDTRAALRIRAGDKVTNNELRRALADHLKPDENQEEG